MKIAVAQPRTRPRSADRGFSLIEVLVSVLLLGLGAGAVMTALGGSIRASTHDREIVAATAWLQTAAEKLELHNSVLCAPTAETARSSYEGEVRREGATDNGEGWPATSISVTAVRFWNGTSFATPCSTHAQLVTLTVKSPSGRTTKSLDVVKAPPIVARTTPPPVTTVVPPCTANTASITVRDVNGNGPNIPRQHRTLPSHLKYKPATITMTVSGTCNSLRVLYTTNGQTYTASLKGSGTTFTGKISPAADQKWALGPVLLTIQQAAINTASWTNLGTNSSAMNIVTPS